MTTTIYSKSATQTAIITNSVESVIIDATGIVSGLGKNKIINGNFGINHRVVTGTVTLAAGIYGHDRFKAGASGCTYTFATALNVTTITISAGSLIQVIEGLNLMSGPVVLSWQGTAQGKIDAGAYSSSGVTGTAVGGTNMSCEFGTGTLKLVQLETGAVASAFEQRLYGAELALCQRYLPSFISQSINDPVCSGYAQTTTSMICTYPFAVTPRVPPTGITSSGGGTQYTFTATVTTAGSAIAFSTSSLMAGVVVLTVTGQVAGQGGRLYCNTPGEKLSWTGCEL